jgi:hypothetical protein
LSGETGQRGQGWSAANTGSTSGAISVSSRAQSAVSATSPESANPLSTAPASPASTAAKSRTARQACGDISIAERPEAADTTGAGPENGHDVLLLDGLFDRAINFKDVLYSLPISLVVGREARRRLELHQVAKHGFEDFSQVNLAGNA